MKKKITTITETIDEAGILISRTTEVTEEPQLQIKNGVFYCGETEIGQLKEMTTTECILGTSSTLVQVEVDSQHLVWDGKPW